MVQEELKFQGFPQVFEKSVRLTFWLRTGTQIGKPSTRLTQQNPVPLLVMYSVNDKRVAPHHSQAIIADAKQLGIPITELKLKGGHGMGIWYEPDRYQQAVVNFFKQSLRSKEN